MPRPFMPVLPGSWLSCRKQRISTTEGSVADTTVTVTSTGSYCIVIDANANETDRIFEVSSDTTSLLTVNEQGDVWSKGKADFSEGGVVTQSVSSEPSGGLDGELAVRLDGPSATAQLWAKIDGQWGVVGSFACW